MPFHVADATADQRAFEADRVERPLAVPALRDELVRVPAVRPVPDREPLPALRVAVLRVEVDVRAADVREDVLRPVPLPRVTALCDELALRPVVERPEPALFPAAVRPPAERAPAPRAPAERAEPRREPVALVELELEPVRVLRAEVLPREEAVRVAEEREEEERDAPVFFVEPPPVDRDPDFAVDDRRVVVAIGFVR